MAHSPDFFNKLVKTDEVLTAGITCIPLTKPAKVFFDVPQDKLDEVVSIFKSMQILYEMQSSVNSVGITIFHLQSIQEIDYTLVKQIWNNFKHLHPKFNSQWRYLLWEIDEKNNVDYGSKVLKMYNMLDLPVYYHESARGWHFLSVKPIKLTEWQQAIKMLRYTNPNWPAVTIRVKCNKYVGELEYFMKGYIQTQKHHSDTDELKRLVETQNMDKLSQKYQLVWYDLHKEENKQ